MDDEQLDSLNRSGISDPKVIRRERNIINNKEEKNKKNKDKYYSHEDLEHILEISSNTKLAAKIRYYGFGVDDWNLDKRKKEASFIQKLPTAVRDRWYWFSKEKSRVRKAQKTFNKADLCTVREKDQLDRVFLNNSHKIVPLDLGNDDDMLLNNEDQYQDNTQKLNEYVGFILNFSFKPSCLSDDYLSQHMNEIYKYAWNLSEYDKLKTQYPEFFVAIPEVK